MFTLNRSRVTSLKRLRDPRPIHLDAEGEKNEKCKKSIISSELYKIVMYVIGEEFTDHHYEHIECPDKFTI